MEISSQPEITFYRDYNVVVTQSRYVTNAKTYAMRNISSVHIYEIVASKKIPLVLGFIGLVLLLSSESKAFGAGLLLLGIILFCALKNSYAVRISTNAGETNSMVSKDRVYIQKIVNALNEAIIHRG